MPRERPHSPGSHVSAVGVIQGGWHVAALMGPGSALAPVPTHVQLRACTRTGTVAWPTAISRARTCDGLLMGPPSPPTICIPGGNCP